MRLQQAPPQIPTLDVTLLPKHLANTGMVPHPALSEGIGPDRAQVRGECSASPVPYQVESCCPPRPRPTLLAVRRMRYIYQIHISVATHSVLPSRTPPRRQPGRSRTCRRWRRGPWRSHRDQCHPGGDPRGRQQRSQAAEATRPVSRAALTPPVEPCPPPWLQSVAGRAPAWVPPPLHTGSDRATESMPRPQKRTPSTPPDARLHPSRHCLSLTRVSIAVAGRLRVALRRVDSYTPHQ